MLAPHFYHEHTRRAVAVFGTLFNDINVVKRDGSGRALSNIKVPLSYGPRQKFLARLKNEQYLEDEKLAIKLPRMSFEISSIEYDESKRLQRGTKFTIPSQDSSLGQIYTYHPSTYRLGFELSIISRHTEDALQILEQILPYFQPEYTVTVNEIDNNFKTDMPFVLKSVDMSDDYEGEFTSRRSLIYTLSFETRINYYGPIHEDSGTIREVKVDIAEDKMTSSGPVLSSSLITITPKTATEDDNFTINVSFNPNLYDRARIDYTMVGGEFELNETVVGSTSGATAVVSSIDSSTILLTVPDDRFVVGESLTGEKSGAVLSINSIEEIWDTSNS